MSISHELVKITGFNHDTFPSCFTTRRAAVPRPSVIASALETITKKHLMEFKHFMILIEL